MQSGPKAPANIPGAVEEHDLVDSAHIGDGELVVTLIEGAEDYTPLSALLVERGFGLKSYPSACVPGPGTALEIML